MEQAKMVCGLDEASGYALDWAQKDFIEQNDIPVLDAGFVKLVDWMGSDLSVANAARVSFKKRKTEFQPGDGKGSDEKLIKFLADHDHWTPFGHVVVCLHMKMPLNIARQFMRSNVGIVYNETSRRYVTDEPEFYHPKEWRKRPEGNIKQGSGEAMSQIDQVTWKIEAAKLEEDAVALYSDALKAGMAPEMARMFLPQSMYTELWATMSLAAAARVVKLRDDSHAQFEVQEYARAISTICGRLFHHSWKALTEKKS